MFDREVPEEEEFAGIWGIVQSLVISASQVHGFRSGNDLKVQVFMVTGRWRGTTYRTAVRAHLLMKSRINLGRSWPFHL